MLTSAQVSSWRSKTKQLFIFLPPRQESFTKETGRMSTSPSSHPSSAPLWGTASTGASPAARAAAVLLVTWCCSPPWRWPAAPTAPSTWETSISCAGSTPTDTPEPYWNSSEANDLVGYACDNSISEMISGTPSPPHTHRGELWDLEPLIDSSTIKIKLAQLLWVSVALAWVWIRSRDLFDLDRIHAAVGLHANRACEVQTWQTLIYLFRIWEKLKVFKSFAVFFETNIYIYFFFSVDYDNDVSDCASGSTFPVSVIFQARNLNGIAQPFVL